PKKPNQMGEKSEKLNVAHFISDSGQRDRQILYEFIASAIAPASNSHFYILNGNKQFITFLNEKGIQFTLLDFLPSSICDILRCAWELRKKMRQYDVVHTHYYDANILGLLTAYFAQVPKRITTRHHNAFDSKMHP